MKSIIFAISVTGIFMPVAGQAANIAVNQANLALSLAAAQPGDKLIFAAGGYGAVIIPRKSWANPITLDMRKASMTGIVIRGASGVSILGGTIIGSVAYGIHIADSSRISVDAMDISGSPRGIVVADSTDVTITRNNLHHLRSDGINVVGQRVRIDRNKIYEMQPITGDHPDGIQLWSANGVPTSDVTITRNTIVGKTQGIFARTPDLGLRRISILNNTVRVSYPNGVVLLDAEGSKVVGNVVRSLTNGKSSKANVRVEGENNIACGNIVPDVPYAPGAIIC